MQSADTLKSEALLSPVWSHLTNFKPVRGEGIYLYNAEGERMMDFTSGIGVVNTGHCHPQVVKAIQEQSENLLFAQMNCVVSPVTIKLAEKLNEITPPHIDRFFFANSGAEATEGSIKLAKAATGRPNVIVFQGSFHGRTHLAMAMTTSKTIYRHKYHPLPSGVFVAPFPYQYYYGWDEEITVEFCKKQLDLLLCGQTAPDETAAIIIEPVLGEGGYVPAPAAFLRYLRTVCDEHNILLIMDEVQSGLGRTGKMFCFEHAEVEPDIIVMAKGLGSGLPISAIASTKVIMDKWKPGTHGGTYGGGSTLACAAACATIDILSEDGLLDNALERGTQLTKGLLKLKNKYPMLGDVRGLGLMVGVEFSNSSRTADPDFTRKLATACIRRNLLLLTCGSYKNVIRWIPPLIVTAEQIDEGLAIFEASIIDVLSKN